MNQLAPTDRAARQRAALSVLAAATLLAGASHAEGQEAFRLNDREYFVRGGVNVMAFQDIYPEGHQGGLSIVQHDVRVASNGDLRLEPTPGQWQPVPRQVDRVVDGAGGRIMTRLVYPDTSKHLKGFNPIVYPDLELGYTVTVEAAGEAVRVRVDLDDPLPAEWVGLVGFNLELFPTDLFGRGWYLGGDSGVFPRQPNGPVTRDGEGEVQAVPFARGPRLTIAPEVAEQRLVIESLAGDLELLDGRIRHTNGWFVVRSLVPAGATAGAVEWLVRPHVMEGWQREPVVQLSQVGYHPGQSKVAVIEVDARDGRTETARLERVREEGGFEAVVVREPEEWRGDFLRYRYLRFDFTEVERPGMYVVEYGGYRTEPFRISADVFDRGVWQPTIDHYLPIQMCHVRVEEKYRVWHGVDHLDDARMAPPDSNHFDGYVQGPSTLTQYAPYERVPGLNVGGWHDAGDDDLRIESQSNEVWVLASAYEEFGVDYDNTMIDQASRLVRIHEPDGVADLLQQVEHGILSILGGYRALGRLYRGIIVPTLDQYVMVGDPTNYTDNLEYDPALAPDERTATSSGVPDDRLVFTEMHPAHEYQGIRALAIAGRVLRDYRPELAREATEAAESLWRMDREPGAGFDQRVGAAAELLLTTGKAEYRDALLAEVDGIAERIGSIGWLVGRVLPLMADAEFEAAIRAAVSAHAAGVAEAQRQNPYGVPYEPHIWGAGWGIQDFGVRQYFLHTRFPDLVPPDYMLNALNFVLGTHPGRNTASFVSGVGSRSVTTAYGFNRGDWHYIPGGSVSGTALIRPDLPELKDFPYLWQQVEYVMGGGATNAMFLALGARALLDDRPTGGSNHPSAWYGASGSNGVTESVDPSRPVAPREPASAHTSGAPQPRISVQGNRFVDPAGETVVFRGFSVADPDRLERIGQWNRGLFEEARRWNANVVRLPVHPRAWRARGPEAYLALLDQGIAWAEDVGLYVIVDWHSIGNLQTGLFQSDGYNTSRTETLRFWKAIAERYGKRPSVAFYELFNEPTTYHGTLGRATWSEHKAFMEEIIHVIRAHDAPGIPLVAGFNWAYDLTEAGADPIDAPDVAYVTHPYPQKREPPWEPQWQEDWGFLADRYPIVASEFGFMSADGRGAHVPVIADEAYGEAIIDFFEERGISWIAWVFDPLWSPQLIADWDFTPTVQGRFFKRKMMDLNPSDRR